MDGDSYPGQRPDLFLPAVRKHDKLRGVYATIESGKLKPREWNGTYQPPHLLIVTSHSSKAAAEDAFLSKSPRE